MVLWIAVFAGFLSFSTAEILAGSQPNWILNPFSFAIASFTYFIHINFFVMLALRLHRTGWRSLYFFGVLFGLYESWLTKVIWVGYGAGNHPFGAIAGFGAHESTALILFYHPCVSFILPLAILCQISPAFSQRFSHLNWLFSEERTARSLQLLMILAFASISSAHLGTLNVILTTWIPTLLTGALGYLLLKNVLKTQGEEYFAALESNLIFVVISLSLAIWYIGCYFLFLPERLPAWQIQMATLCFYLVVILLIFRQAPDNLAASTPTHTHRAQTVWIVATLIAGGALAFFFMPQVRLPIYLCAQIGFMPLGVGLFLWSSLKSMHQN